MRVDRIGVLIQKEIAEILHRKINDKRIGFVTITGVKVTKDLSIARVYYSHIGSLKDRQDSHKGLKSATKFIKGEIGKVLHTARVPEIYFEYDDRIEKTSNLINQINALSDES